MIYDVEHRIVDLALEEGRSDFHGEIRIENLCTFAYMNTRNRNSRDNPLSTRQAKTLHMSIKGVCFDLAVTAAVPMMDVEPARHT